MLWETISVSDLTYINRKIIFNFGSKKEAKRQQRRARWTIRMKENHGKKQSKNQCATGRMSTRDATTKYREKEKTRKNGRMDGLKATTIHSNASLERLTSNKSIKFDNVRENVSRFIDFFSIRSLSCILSTHFRLTMTLTTRCRLAERYEMRECVSRKWNDRTDNKSFVEKCVDEKSNSFPRIN